MSELLRAINNLNNREYGPEDIQELHRALSNGEIKITMDGQLTVGDIAPSMGAATIPGIQSSFNISVPPEVIQELLNARPSTPLQLPPRAIHFRSRVAELNNLLNQLRVGETYTLVGPGGIGKSALAAQALWQLTSSGNQTPEDYPDGVIYHSFHTQPESKQFLSNIALAYGEEPGTSPLAAARRALTDRCAIIYLEGAEDAQDLEAVLGPLQQCAVLITSRKRSHLGERGQELEPLELDDAAALLSDYARSKYVEIKSVRRICTLTGGLPLASYLAGNYLSAFPDNLGEYLDWLEESRLGKLKERDRSRASPATLLRYSFQRLNVHTRMALGMASALALAPIPSSLFAAVLGLNQREIAPWMLELVKTGLLRPEGASYRVAHILIHTYAEKYLPTPDNLYKRLAEMASKANQSGYPGRLRALVPHLQHAARQVVDSDPELATWLFNELGYHFQATGDLQSALAYFSRALDLRSEILGEQHPDTATSLNNLGALLKTMGDYDTARLYYQRALMIRSEVLGDNHPDTASSLNNLGALFDNMGDFQAAMPYFDRALSIFETSLGAKHPNTATCHNNLGYLLQAMGKLEEAQPHYARALKIRTEVLGEKHPETAASFNNMGALYRAMGDLESARPCYNRALAIRRDLLGEMHPGTASSLNSLGELLIEMGAYQEARPYLERALEIRTKVLGKSHPDRATSLNNLGLSMRALGDLETARTLYQEALDIRTETLGEKHPDTAVSLNNLGALLQEQGRYEEARTVYMRSLDIFKGIHGDEHPCTATAFNQMGQLLECVGDQKAAQPYYERALEIRVKTLGDEHPDTATSYNDLGTLLGHLGDLETAKEYCKRAFGIYRENLGLKHPFTAICLSNMGGFYLADEEYKIARACFERSLNLCRDVFGDVHPQTGTAYLWQGRLYSRLNNNKRARSCFDKALQAFEASLPEDHPSITDLSFEISVLENGG